MISSNFPRDLTLSEYGAFRDEPSRWLPMVRALCSDLGYGSLNLVPIRAGSNLICELGKDSFIKIFPPFLKFQFESERRTLKHLRGQLSVSIPEIQAEGELSSWCYLILSRVEGAPLEKVWVDCSLEEKSDLMFQLGKIMAEVHQIPVGELAKLEPQWNKFLATQISECAARHRKIGLSETLVSDMDHYVNLCSRHFPKEFCPVILTGEYTPENVLVVYNDGRKDGRENGRWLIKGLIDFGDTMVGFHEYDLIGPCTFLAAGEKQLLDQLFNGYGLAPNEVGASLRERLMTLLLLHRYSNLEIQIRMDFWRDRAQTLKELAALVWPI
jgi:hygromycin-B 7''-O-kinase